MMLFRDIDEDEENRIPLPSGWVRSVKLVHQKKKSEPIKMKVFRNVAQGYELDIHPILDRAIRQVKKLPLPQEWVIVNQTNENGANIRTYLNMDKKITMLDHPLLRYCVMESLQSLGLSTDCIEFYEPEDLHVNTDFQHNEEESVASNHDIDDQNPHLFINGGLQPGQRFDPFDTVYFDPANQVGPISPLTFAPTTPATPNGTMRIDFANTNRNDVAFGHENPQIIGDYQDDDYDQVEQDVAGQPVSQTPTVIPRLKFKACIPEQSISEDDVHDFINDLGAGIPPLTSAGIGSLRQDVTMLNRDVHDLLVELRAHYAQREQYIPLLVSINDDDREHAEENEEDHDQNSDGTAVILTNQKLVTMASDVVTKLRQQPDYIIWAIANNSAIGNPAMMKAAFIALHRLMHPFSTDPSITTALLLQSVNYQLEIFSTSAVARRFKREDRSLVLHCLLIDDLQEAMQWNALQAPLPMVPRVGNETVFSCLLRLYSIRRDCTCYYRTIWKPIWPSILTLLTSSINRQSSNLYQNVVTVADRILEFAFLESSLTSFPTIATSVCRAVTEIGTLETMMTTILYYFLLPNLMKILCADHDSLENEQSLRAHQVHQFVNKYFDFTWWMRPDTTTPTSPHNQPGDLQAIDLLRSVVWMVWRLYVVSLYSTEEQVTAMTVEQLNQDRFKSWNTTYLNDDKLRKLLIRSRRRLESAATWLMKMPVDISGTKYLSHDQHSFSIDVQDTDADATAWLEHRIAALQFKPMEMLQLSTISRAEMSDLVTDVAYALEDFQLHEREGDFYHFIRTYLSYYAIEEPEDAKEEFLLLRFVPNDYKRHNSGAVGSGPGEMMLIQDEYQHVSRGLYCLKLYRLALALMIRKVQAQGLSNIHELIGSQLFHLEADLNIPSSLNPAATNSLAAGGGGAQSRVPLAEKHTEGSRQKMRSPHHGLRADRKVKAFPLFAQHNLDNQDLHPNVKSLKAMQDEVVASYRFGSAQPGVDVGSSMGRHRVLPPALLQTQVKVTLLQGQQQQQEEDQQSRVGGSAQQNQRKLRQYTTATIRPDINLLAPTQASLHQQYGVNKRHPPPTAGNQQQYRQKVSPHMFSHVTGERYVDDENPFNKDKSFMTSMRGYSVIPTDQFRQRHAQRRQARFFHQDLLAHPSQQPPFHRQQQRGGRSQNNSAGNQHNSGSKNQSNHLASTVMSAPKPFPEHLRNRIRGYTPEQQQQQQQRTNYRYRDEQQRYSNEYDHEDMNGDYYDGQGERDGDDEKKMDNLTSKLSLLKNLLNRNNSNNHDQFNDYNDQDDEYPQEQPYNEEEEEEQYHHEDGYRNEETANSPQYYQSLVQSFRQQIQPHLSTSSANPNTSPHSPSTSAAGRRQPSMPRPLPDATHLMQPTLAYAQRLQQQPVLTNAQLRDLTAGIPMGLRDYEETPHDNEEGGGGGDEEEEDQESHIVQHPYPFRPNARDVNRPTDPNSIRSPKKPAFLRESAENLNGGAAGADGHQVASSIWSSRSPRSRSPSQSRSRSRSRSGSRSRSRSRSRSPSTSSYHSTGSSHSGSSYARPTRASLIQQAEKAQAIQEAQHQREEAHAKLTPVRAQNAAQQQRSNSKDNSNSSNPPAAAAAAAGGSVYRRRLSSRLAGDALQPRPSVTSATSSSTAPLNNANSSNNNNNHHGNNNRPSVAASLLLPAPQPTPLLANLMHGDNEPTNSNNNSNNNNSMGEVRSSRGSISLEFPPSLPAAVDSAAGTAAVPNTVPVKVSLPNSREKKPRRSRSKDKNKSKQHDPSETSNNSNNNSKNRPSSRSSSPAPPYPTDATTGAVEAKHQFAEAFQRASEEAAQKILNDTKYAINFASDDDDHHDDGNDYDQANHSPSRHSHSSGGRHHGLTPRQQHDAETGATVNLWADRLVAAGYPARLYRSPHHSKKYRLNEQGEEVEEEEVHEEEEEEDDDDGQTRYLAYGNPHDYHNDDERSNNDNNNDHSANMKETGQFFFYGGNGGGQNDPTDGASAAGRIPIIRRRSSVTNYEQAVLSLTQGFTAIKHGRSGKPKEKLLRYNIDEQSIEWTALTKAILNSSNNTSHKRGSLMKKKNSISSFFFSSAANTDDQDDDDNNNNSNNHTGKYNMSAIKETDWSGVYLEDIFCIKRGVQTDVFARAGLLDPNCCLSIITEERTLDLQFANVVERNTLFRGLKTILASRDDIVYK